MISAIPLAKASSVIKFIKPPHGMKPKINTALAAVIIFKKLIIEEALALSAMALDAKKEAGANSKPVNKYNNVLKPKNTKVL